jgi:uncharacterized membrane protein YhaH (DUF805 family)
MTSITLGTETYTAIPSGSAGRMGRRPFFVLTFCVWTASQLLLYALLSLFTAGPTEPDLVFLTGLAMAFNLLRSVILIPSFIRRIHDMGISGGVAVSLLVFGALLPPLLALEWLLMCLTPGTKGDNRYGADPRAV